MVTLLRLQEPVSPLLTDSAESGHTSDVALAARGDLAAFERLYHAHAGRVRALVRRMLGGEAGDHMDELTQDVFVQAWRKLGDFRGEAAFGTWLHRIAVNRCLAHRQQAGLARRRYADDPEPLERAPAPRRSPELRLDIEAAIAALPEGMRRILVLHDIEGFTHEEIAERFGIAVGTSKSQLHRARLALRPLLER